MFLFVVYKFAPGHQVFLGLMLDLKMYVVCCNFMVDTWSIEYSMQTFSYNYILSIQAFFREAVVCALVLCQHALQPRLVG